MQIYDIEKIKTLLTIYDDTVVAAEVGIKDKFEKTSITIYRDGFQQSILTDDSFIKINEKTYMSDDVLVIHIYLFNKEDYLEFECGKEVAVDLNDISNTILRLAQMFSFNGVTTSEAIDVFTALNKYIDSH